MDLKGESSWGFDFILHSCYVGRKKKKCLNSEMSIDVYFGCLFAIHSS